MTDLDSPYEVLPHTQTARSLRRQDRSRYSQVRLTITRNRNETGTVSLIVRDVRGGRLADTRLIAATVNLESGSPASESPVEALRAAVAALLAGLPG